MRRRAPFSLAVLLIAEIALFAHSTPTAAAPATVEPASRLDQQWWKDRHAAVNEAAQQGDVDLLFLGDSITQGWGGDAGRGVWKENYGERKALNAGFGGDRTQHVLWRLDNGNVDGISPKLAVLMIGTNNSGADSSEDIAAGVKAIVAKLRKKLPKTKVLVLAIFPRGQSPDDAHRKVNEGANAIIAELDDGENVHYLDIGEVFLEEDGSLSKDIMPDYLHLSAEGYRRWAEAIEGQVSKLLGEPAAAGSSTP